MRTSIWKSNVADEVKKQVWLAGPLFIVGSLIQSLQLISNVFVGHLGVAALSGASMASSFTYVTGFSLLLGMASGLETLCGQSFGAEQYHMLGIHMQRAMLVLAIIIAFLVIIWANTNSILLALHQDPEISKAAGLYARFLIPSLLPYALLQCLFKFLQAQNIIFPMILSSGFTTLLHVIICWALVFKSRLGSNGAAVAISISYWINVLFLALYVKFSPFCKATWTGFSKEGLHNLISFLKVAIPSAIMMCLKVWTFELMLILSGLLPNPKLETSVLSICLNTFSLAWMIPFGLGGAVSTRVSNELGAGHPEAACLAARVVICMAIAEGILVGLLMILLRHVWAHIFSYDKEVVRHVAATMPVLAAACFLDAIQSVLSGIARGCGWQKIGAYVNLGSFYIVGVPSAIVLAFVIHMKEKGLWLGIISAFAVQAVLLLIITIRTNWVEQANDAAKRVQDSGIPVERAPEGLNMGKDCI